MPPFPPTTILPFSADPQTKIETTNAIRLYWSKVLSAIVKRQGEDEVLLAYKAVNENLGSTPWPSLLPHRLPSEKFIFIDTVVSGRAVNEIIKSFDDIGLKNYHLILLVDGNGNKLRKEYKMLIDQLVHEKKCTLIKVANLFTEDRGPSVSGIWSTVYPQVLEHFSHTYGWESYGAGSFYIRVRTDRPSNPGDANYNLPVTTFYGTLSTCIYIALNYINKIKQSQSNRGEKNAGRIDQDSLNNHETSLWAEMVEQITMQLNHEISTIQQRGYLSPLDQQTTRLLAEPRVHELEPTAQVSVSGSHLIRVHYEEKILKAKLRAIDQALNNKDDTLKNYSPD